MTALTLPGRLRAQAPSGITASYVNDLPALREAADDLDRLLAALVQVIAVCDDNRSDDCNSTALALKFVRDVAATTLSAMSVPPMLGAR